jgi:hypothetical protein
MSKKLKSVGATILLAGSLLLAACNSPAASPDAPTLDANAVYTQAAQTVQAGVAATDAARPTATITETPAPTNTLDPTVDAALTSTAQAVNQPPTADPNAQAGVGTETPTQQITPLIQATATTAGGAPPVSSGDAAEWVSQSPTDGTKIQQNATWDMKIVVKNTGTTTWNSKYALKFYAGDRMESPSDFYIQGEVKPNELYTFLFTMKAPDSTGDKQTNWVIQNADGRNFYAMYLQVEVIE